MPIDTDANGNYLGHLLFGGVFPNGKVMQIFAVPSARKRGVARMLLNELVNHAQKRQFLSLSAKVADDLREANAFYENSGFRVVSTRAGGKTRKRVINHRVRELETPSLFDLMDPQPHELLPNLGLSGKYTSWTPIYAIDLNVLFDVSKNRIRSEEAGMVFIAGQRNDIRPVVTEEFIVELERNAADFPNDPILHLARRMQTLPTPKKREVQKLENELAPIVFPERHSQNVLTKQDKSDLRHLAISIHHKVAGFVTSEKALHRAHQKLLLDFTLEIISPTDFADAIFSGNEKIDVTGFAQTPDAELISCELDDVSPPEARAFLMNRHIPSEKNR